MMARHISAFTLQTMIVIWSLCFTSSAAFALAFDNILGTAGFSHRSK